jgi:hypothetical protein
MSPIAFSRSPVAEIAELKALASHLERIARKLPDAEHHVAEVVKALRERADELKDICTNASSPSSDSPRP